MNNNENQATNNLVGVNPVIQPQPVQPTPEVVPVVQPQPAPEVAPVVQPQPVQPAPAVTPVAQPQPAPEVTSAVENSNTTIQQQMQNIPTVEQGKQEFISNTQANEPVKKESKKSSTGLILVIILFVVILAAVFFLFPILFKNL